MELLLILTYTAICIGIFKLFRLPVNKWTVPTAVLGGIFIIGALVVVMNYNHPYSESVRQYYATIPIVPQVRGRVTEIPVEVNTLVAKDDLLFRIDPIPYREKVDAVMAELEGAADDLASKKEELKRSEELLRQGAGSEREVQRWRIKYDQANAQVNEPKAELEKARFDLDSTEVRAPSDGFVTMMILREGMMAGMAVMSATMSFFPVNDVYLVGWFRQNSLLRLRAGTEAEVAFDAFPGQIFKGKVDRVLPVIPEGQLLPDEKLIAFQTNAPPGRVPVLIKLDDPPRNSRDQPIGLYGQAALYTEHAHHIAVMRRILLRMSGWLNYLFPFH
jgi:multidrug resistance efflux pump